MAAELILRDVAKSFDGRRVVDGVDLDIAAGEMFFLLGPSGCGKTTLLRCIAGFGAPESGVIRLGGEDITRRPPHERGTAMVFQSYALWPHLTVRDNVAFGLELRRLPRAEIRRRTDEALATVHMADRADHRPAQLSGGQQQRVALARALVVRPRCLLLDEPLSNLDAKLRLEMRGEIRRICRAAGLTAVYVTHDQKEALSIADRLAILNRGRIEQCGAPADVYRRPVNRFTAQFIGETNFLPGRLRRRGAGELVVETVAGPVRATQAPDELADGAAALVSLRPEFIRLEPPPPGAPNVFAAQLLETEYLGELASHRLRLAAARAGAEPPELKVFELRPRHMAGVQRDVTCWMDPAEVVVLADDAPPRAAE